MLKEGLKISHKKIVTADETAAKAASGTLDVYGTPFLIAFMEKTSLDIITPFLKDGESTVGISMNMKHVKANKIGDEIVCKSELIKIEGKKLTFKVIATHNDKIIGEAIHERFIIDIDRFLSKLK
ncbi:thioesterase family protein [Fusobacterium sp. MFO224]|uniref:thioesterase family protein n=1 Tax=Fusobacterium sp. MFO224 TaxID=3378070 RepID=UPI003853F714